MRTRQRTKIEELPCHNWHLDITVPKTEIARDLKLLTDTSLPNSKKCKNTKDKILPLHKEELQEKGYNGRVTRGKKQVVEITLLPVKKRLTSGADNLAVERLCDFCKEIWAECLFSFFFNFSRYT